MKCDLTQPACKRCTSTGRKCEGYPIDDASLSDQVDYRNEQYKPQLLRLAPRSFPTMLDGEQRHFSYFRQQTAYRFGGYFEDDLWSQLVLQLAASEDSICQMTIALGFLHESFNHPQGHTNYLRDNRGVPDPRQHYSKAVGHLRSLIADHGWAKLEVTLTACILCIGFDWLRGEPESASVHLRAGLRILKRWYTSSESLSHSPKFHSSTGCIIQQKIAPFYSRLTLQAGSMYDFSLRWYSFSTPRTAIAPFMDLDHARDSLIDLVGQMQLVPETRALLQEQDGAARLLHGRFESQLAAWQMHFDNFTAVSNSSNPAASPRLGTYMTRLLYLVATVMLSTMHTEDTDMGNKHGATFKQILDTAESMLGIESAKFTIDLGVVAMIYYVAIHSQQSVIHGRACDLLAEYQLHEGFWSSHDALEDAHKKRQLQTQTGKLTLEYLRWS